MNSYIPSIDQIQPHWFEKWGATFGSTDLGAEMISNPRIRERAYQQMLDRSDIDQTAVLSEVELACIHAFTEKRDRLQKLCGLVVHGRCIRESVTKQSFDLISKQFGLDDLKLAMGLRDMHPDIGDFEIELARLGEMVTRSGLACIQQWRSSQSEQVQLRLALVDDGQAKTEPSKLAIGHDQILSIVEHVGTELAAL